MKTPKTIAKRYKIKCNWEKYTPSCQKGQKSVLCHTFFIYKKNIFPLFNYIKNKLPVRKLAITFETKNYT